MAIEKLPYVVATPKLRKITVKDAQPISCVWSIPDNGFIIPQDRLILDGVEYGDEVTFGMDTFNLVLAAHEEAGVLSVDGPVYSGRPPYSNNSVYACLVIGGVTGLGVSGAKMVIYAEKNTGDDEFYDQIMNITDPMGTYVDTIIAYTPVFDRGTSGNDKPVYQNMPNGDIGTYVMDRLGYLENSVEFKGFTGGPGPATLFDGHDNAIFLTPDLKVYLTKHDGDPTGDADNGLKAVYDGTSDAYGIFVNYEVAPAEFITALFVCMESEIQDVRDALALFGIPLPATGEMYRVFQNNGLNADYTYVFNPAPPGPEPQPYPQSNDNQYPKICGIMSIEKELIDDVNMDGLKDQE
jgi:hypothetical protein